MRFIHVIFTIDAIVVLAFLFLFLNGISIASIFSFSTGIWWALVVGVPVIFASSVILDQHGFHRMAVGLSRKIVYSNFNFSIEAIPVVKDFNVRTRRS